MPHTEGFESSDIFAEFSRYQGEQEKLGWNGSFAEYFEKVAKKPGIIRSSHQLLLESITRRDDFFETGENALFGMEKTTERLVKVLSGAAEGLATGKRIIVFMGPPGGGKSTLVNSLKRGLEAYSRTDDGEMYSISGCPMNEEPLHLFPRELRPMLKDRYQIHVEGDLCPVCAFNYRDKDMAELKSVQVKRLVLSESERVGIGTFKPSDPKSQDITELVGSVDFSKLPEYGSASDPRAYRFDGELNIANRGLMEFVEMLKVDDKFLYALLDLVQDRVIKPPRFANIYADEVIVAHTNEAEYSKYVAKKENEAMRDRMIIVPVPYNLRLSDEEKIYEKEIARKAKRVHIAPKTLRVSSVFAVLSRLEDSKKSGMDKIKKMKVYDDQYVDGITQKDAKELREEVLSEGMNGISPRFMADSLSNALISSGVECLTPTQALKSLLENIDTHSYTRDMSSDDKEKVRNLVSLARKEYDEEAKREVQTAFVYSFKESATTLFEKYFDNIEAWGNKTKMKDPITGDDVDPDEKLMRSIEEQIGIAESAKKDFRDEVTRRISALARRGEKFDYTSHPRLKEAIEGKLFADLKDLIKVTTSVATPNKEQLEKVNEVALRLREEKGYCAVCANDLIKYVGQILNR